MLFVITEGCCKLWAPVFGRYRYARQNRLHLLKFGYEHKNALRA
jgi:hypothetical protein